jgi:hypothetical protein
LREFFSLLRTNAQMGGSPSETNESGEDDAVGKTDAMTKYTNNAINDPMPEIEKRSKLMKEKYGRNQRKIVRLITGPIRNSGRCLDFMLRMVGIRK